MKLINRSAASSPKNKQPKLRSRNPHSFKCISGKNGTQLTMKLKPNSTAKKCWSQVLSRKRTQALHDAESIDLQTKVPSLIATLPGQIFRSQEMNEQPPTKGPLICLQLWIRSKAQIKDWNTDPNRNTTRVTNRDCRRIRCPEATKMEPCTKAAKFWINTRTEWSWVLRTATRKLVARPWTVMSATSETRTSTYNQMTILGRSWRISRSNRGLRSEWMKINHQCTPILREGPWSRSKKRKDQEQALAVPPVSQHRLVSMAMISTGTRESHTLWIQLRRCDLTNKTQIKTIIYSASEAS